MPRSGIGSGGSGRPPKVTDPEVGCSWLSRIRRNVDLPQPLAPTTAQNSPGSIARLTRSSTTASP
jgi:hypothetical protein